MIFCSIVATERAEIAAARRMEARSGKAPSFTRFLDLDEVIFHKKLIKTQLNI